MHRMASHRMASHRIAWHGMGSRRIAQNVVDAVGHCYRVPARVLTAVACYSPQGAMIRTVQLYLRLSFSLISGALRQGCGENPVSARKNGTGNSLHGRAADDHRDPRHPHGRRHVPPPQVRPHSLFVGCPPPLMRDAARLCHKGIGFASKSVDSPLQYFRTGGVLVCYWCW